MLSWANRRLTYQSNSHQFSELLECVQVRVLAMRSEAVACAQE